MKSWFSLIKFNSISQVLPLLGWLVFSLLVLILFSTLNVYKDLLIAIFPVAGVLIPAHSFHRFNHYWLFVGLLIQIFIVREQFDLYIFFQASLVLMQILGTHFVQEKINNLKLGILVNRLIVGVTSGVLGLIMGLIYIFINRTSLFMSSDLNYMLLSFFILHFLTQIIFSPFIYHLLFEFKEGSLLNYLRLPIDVFILNLALSGILFIQQTGIQYIFIVLFGYAYMAYRCEKEKLFILNIFYLIVIAIHPDPAWGAFIGASSIHGLFAGGLVSACLGLFSLIFYETISVGLSRKTVFGFLALMILNFGISLLIFKIEENQYFEDFTLGQQTIIEHFQEKLEDIKIETKNDEELKILLNVIVDQLNEASQKSHQVIFDLEYNNFHFRSNVNAQSLNQIKQSQNLIASQKNFNLMFYPTRDFGHEYFKFYIVSILVFTFLTLLLQKLAIEGLNSEMVAKDLAQSLSLKLVQSGKHAALGEMASGIAHEINNPLTIIYGRANQLIFKIKKGQITNEDIILEIQKIIEHINRISKIVKGLKSLARNAEADPLVPINSEPIITETLGICSERFKNNGIELIINNNCTQNFLGRATQIEQVLINLLNNAFDAILDKYENPWVKVDVSQVDQWIEFSVTDCGGGISEEVQKKLFQSFFTTKEVGKGTGIGLSLSRQILKEHNGELNYDPTSPNTKFYFRIPVL